MGVVDSHSAAAIKVTATSHVVERSRDHAETLRAALLRRRGRSLAASDARSPAGAGARAHQARPRARDRRGPPARVRQLRRAARALRLRRRLRGEEPARRRGRLPQGRDGRRPRPRRHAAALARRQLRFGLQLEGRHRPARPAARAPRPRVGRARDQPLRHRRVPHLLRAPEGRALPLHQRGPRLGGGRPQLGRLHQRVGEHLLGAAAAQERARAAVEREDLGPRQRDRRPLAARPQERRGLRQVRARGGEGHAPGGRLDQADRVGLLQLRAGLRLGGLEPHRARAAGEPDRLHLAPHLRRQPHQQLRAVPGVRPGRRRPHRGREGPDPRGAHQQPAGAPDRDRLRRVERLVPDARARHDRVRHCQDRARGALQLRGRARDGCLPERVLPPRRRGEDGEPGAARERDRADVHEPAGDVPPDDLLPDRGVREAEGKPVARRARRVAPVQAGGSRAGARLPGRVGHLRPQEQAGLCERAEPQREDRHHRPHRERRRSAGRPGERLGAQQPGPQGDPRLRQGPGWCGRRRAARP